MILTSMSAVLMSVVDSMMVGRLGVTELAAIAFAGSIYILGVISGQGMASGFSTVFAAACAKRDHAQKRELFASGLAVQVGLGLLVTAFLWAFLSLPFHYGQTEAVSDFAKDYLWILSGFLALNLMAQTFKTVLVCHDNTLGPMVIVYVAALLNVGLNFCLIFGWGGFPAMGIKGAALATGISQVFSLLVLVVLVYRNHQLTPLGIFKDADSEQMKQIAKIGGAFAFQWLIEVAAFTASATIIGKFSEVHLAAHQISLNVTSLMFMIPAAMGAAATIKISAARSTDPPPAVRNRALLYLLVTVGVSFVTASFMFATRNLIPSLYTDSVAVTEVATTILMIAACFQLADGLQGVASGILRGYRDIKIPTAIISLCWWFFTLPLGYYLSAIKGLGATGMWLGLTTGIVSASILLCLRLKVVSSRV